jgi:hypothetical protein
MLITLVNIFNLVSYEFYVIVIFEFDVVQIYGSGLYRHDPKKIRRSLGLGSATFSTLWVSPTRPKKILAFLSQAHLI